MKTTASKENSTPSKSSQPFFNKKGEGSFLSSTNEVEQPFFSPNPGIQWNPISSSFSGGHNFANIPIFSPRSQPVIQTKLTINEPGDKYEQEADAMADRVMRMSTLVSANGDENLVQTKPLNNTTIQRKCATCEGEEKVQRQEMEEEEEEHLQTKPLMRKAAGGGYTASPQLASQLNSSKGGGDPLPSQTLATMNHSFGADFSTVRVHTGSPAAEMSQGIQAKAFTHGSDIYFNRGQYSPESSEGKRLLGHELTHVVQQGAAAFRASGKYGVRVRVLDRTRDPVIQTDRSPDLNVNSFQTFYIDIDRFRRVLAFQIGVQPGERRLSIRIAALAASLTNPPEGGRTMILAMPTSMPRNPRIVAETESQVGEDVYEKMIVVTLGDIAGSPVVNILARYGRSSSQVPFPDGHFETRMLNHAWMSVSDGVRDMAVNFSSEVPGSLYTPEWRLFAHPNLRLGVGFINTRTGQFVQYPREPLWSGGLNPEEATRFAIHLIPIAGSLIMAYEAIYGRTIFGRRLSTSERVLLGAGAVLSELGPILRVGGGAIRAAEATAAAVRLSQATRIGTADALRLVYGARVLTTTERQTLALLAAQVRAGGTLSAPQQVVANRLLGKLSEPATAVTIRSEVEAMTGMAVQAGRFTVPTGLRVSVDEIRVGQALARDLNADVVKVGESTVQGVRSGDYLVNGQFFEAYSPRTGDLDSLLSKAVSKHQQAGTLVIDLSHCPIPASEVIRATPRIYGRPEAADLSRVVYVQESRVVGNVARQGAPSIAPEVGEGIVIRGTSSSGSQAGRPEAGP